MCISWGRILASAGSVSDSLSKPLDPSRVSVSFIPAATLSDTTPLKLLTRGEPETVDEERAKVILSEEDLEIKVELGIGNESAVYWTCDLSHVSALSGALDDRTEPFCRNMFRSMGIIAAERGWLQ